MMLKVNVMPRKQPQPHRSIELKLGPIIILALTLLLAIGLWLILYKAESALGQECFDQGGSEVVETNTGQIMCLKGNTIMWRK